MKKGWWRRNAAALIVAAVLLPLTPGIVMWNEWRGSSATTAATRPVKIVEGQDATATFANATWGPIKSKELTDTTGLTVPPGAKVVLVQIPVSPDMSAQKDGAVQCFAPTLIEQSSGRQWNEMRNELGVPFDQEEPSSCLPNADGDYSLMLPFILPAGAAGPYWVSIDVLNHPEFVRFSIDP